MRLSDLSNTCLVYTSLPPEIIKGKGQSIVAGENKELSFTSNAAFSDFIRVELDGKTLDEKYYTVKEGSTVVTLKADYVATLSVGEHTIGIVSTNGTATTTFTVKAKTAVDNDTDSPQTGDNSNMASVSYTHLNKVLYEYHGSDTDVVIKDGTVAVSDFACGENTKIEKVTCPDSLRYLGCAVGQSADGVFFKCTNLKTVVLNEGLEHIGVGAFENCSAIDNFDFPDSLNYVGYLAFSGTSWANNLPKGEIYIGKIFYKYNPQGELTEPTTITVKEGTVGIADRAFCRFETDYADFVNLVGVNIPDSVTWIGDEAFYRATDLQEIKLPKNLTELGWRAFGFCASLKEITIPKGVKKLPQYILSLIHI